MENNEHTVGCLTNRFRDFEEKSACGYPPFTSNTFAEVYEKERGIQDLGAFWNKTKRYSKKNSFWRTEGGVTRAGGILDDCFWLVPNRVPLTMT